MACRGPTPALKPCDWRGATGSRLLGDPDFAKVPTDRLLSDDYAQRSAAEILAAVEAGKFLAHGVKPNPRAALSI